MVIEDEIRLDHVYVHQLHDKFLEDAAVNVDVLRLDRIHPVVSGNKWFKLKYHLQYANKHSYRSIATFGGAFSNHIVATAYACHIQRLDCTGYIRGERPKHLSQTLLDAQALNMHLEFVSRKDFTNKQVLIDRNPAVYFIPEGGYGDAGVRGAAEILQ
ncbi:MAG TPA: 1-aminocyclopropane-1-carboxylate deaminase, partial [Parafilimonas sp.]|nr:1-aminocyclopropane-1-carboxylate deaminase [Parafilimonas sp.]